MLRSYPSSSFSQYRSRNRDLQRFPGSPVLGKLLPPRAPRRFPPRAGRGGGELGSGRGVGWVRGPAFLPAQRVGLRAGAGSPRADLLSSLQSLRRPPGSSAELRLQELARGADSVELA